ncbi:TPM domain-containing protein [Aurantiacibacter flavus]|uniref:TPM domain-containing protein n=1 Tax=Aurantiacibacter flavus TaxID=3145232 RepID=A0ABV0CYR7_9SPHN
MAILDPAQHKIVSDAVAQAELTTSGEIVPVLTQASDSYSDVVLAYCAAIAFTVMSVMAAFPTAITDLWDGAFGGWGHDWTTGEFTTLMLGVGVVAFAATWAVLQIDALKFRLVPGPLKRARVRDAAVRHFKVGAESRTHGRTGVMLYLSMQEHRAEIVADSAIAELVPAEVWGEAMADMLAEVRKGCLADGIAAGVRDVGKVLSPHFPRADDDVNELPDRLIEL